MIVKDFIEKLNLSELGQINLGNNNEDGITSHNHSEVINFLNVGMREICKKKDIYQTAKARVHMVPPKMLYSLNQDVLMDAKNNIPNSEAYLWPIEDYTFYSQISRITEIRNDKDLMTASDGIEMRSMNSFYVLNPENFEYLDVTYRYLFSFLNKDGPLDSQEISIPEYLHEALTYYVTYRMLSGRSHVDPELRQRMHAMYRNQMEDFTNLGYEKPDDPTPEVSIFERNGFI